MWSTMEEADWMEAFACHPRIGERKAAHATARSMAWSRQEQASAADAADRVMDDLAEGNRLYEERFGFTYIVCATGKSAEEMLAILNRRLARDRSDRVARGSRTTTADHADSPGKVAGIMSRITTHVLDTVLGKPAAGVAVRLEMKQGDAWTAVAAGETDADGRCRDLAEDAVAGDYRLTFSTGAYSGAPMAAPASIRRFQSRLSAQASAHYHLPLLLSDNSYTTYRGS